MAVCRGIRPGSGSMRDKLCVITGASSGIGRGVATALAKMDAVPVLLSHDSVRGRETFELLSSINMRVDWIPADLASLASVRHFAEQFYARYEKCDLLFNCAGVQKMQREVSPDGLELMFAKKLSMGNISKRILESLWKRDPLMNPMTRKRLNSYGK